LALKGQVELVRLSKQIQPMVDKVLPLYFLRLVLPEVDTVEEQQYLLGIREIQVGPVGGAVVLV
jgi:hypothetical protein